MHLTWEICDLNQTVIVTAEAMEERLPGAKVTIPMPQHGGARSASVQLALDDPAAVEGAGSYNRLLRVKLWGESQDVSTPVFIGPITTPKIEQPGVITVNALDAWHHLERSYLKVDDGLEVPVAAGSTDSAQVIWTLIDDYASAGHGIVAGSLADSLNLGLVHGSGDNIANEILRYLNAGGGPDIELDPTVAIDGTHVTLNVFPTRQGSDLSGSVIFEHGTGAETAEDFSWEPVTPINKHMVIGKGNPADPATHYAYIAQHNGSIALYGEWATTDTLDSDNATVLAVHAQAIVAANAFPVEWFTFKSAPMPEGEEPGVPIFGPGRDFWIGDTIAIEAVTPEIAMTLNGRVLQGAYVEGESSLAYEVECAPEDWSAGVTGAADTAWIEEGV